MIAFISLKFSWLYIPMALIAIGGPLLALLMILRAVVHVGRARQAALATMFAMAGLWGAVWAYFDATPHEATYAPLVVALLVVLGGCWLWSALAATRYRIWTDLAVLAIPVGLGLLAWYTE